MTESNVLFALDLLANLFGVAAAILLAYGSIGRPWNIQTWDGTSPAEVAHDRRRRTQRVVGLALLGAFFVIQCGLIAFRWSRASGWV